VNLREQGESDLSFTLEGDFGLPVYFRHDGVQYGSEADPVEAQVLWDHSRMNPDSGEPVIVQAPVVTVRLSTMEALGKVPEPGETWELFIPEKPSRTATKVEYIVTGDNRSIEKNESIGFVRFYPQELEQE
jgi:hypothetical protein